MGKKLYERISVNDTIELIDIYDENRELTGVILPRGTFLNPGQFQLYALAALETPDGRLLITQRSENESWGAGWWEIGGGGVPAGETSAYAIMREVREETGLDVSACKRDLADTYVNIDPKRGHNYFTDIWHFRLPATPSAGDVVLQEEESVAWQLARWEDIEALNEQGIFLHFARVKTALGK